MMEGSGSLILHVKKAGQPSDVPLILLHAFPLDGSMWEPQAKALYLMREVWVIWLPGFGRSPLPASSWSIEECAEGVERLLLDAGRQRAILCGLSMGGYVALAFASLFPERLAGLILADTRAAADSPEAKEARTRLLDQIFREGTDGFIEEILQKLLIPASLKAGGAGRSVRKIIARQDYKSIMAAVRALRDRPDRRPDLARIACPTLVLCGAGDRITPPAEVQNLARAIPNAAFALVPRAGHLSNMENPKAFNREVRDFLQRLSPE